MVLQEQKLLLQQPLSTESIQVLCSHPIQKDIETRPAWERRNVDGDKESLLKRLTVTYFAPLQGHLSFGRKVECKSDTFCAWT